MVRGFKQSLVVIIATVVLIFGGLTILPTGTTTTINEAKALEDNQINASSDISKQEADSQGSSEPTAEPTTSTKSTSSIPIPIPLPTTEDTKTTHDSSNQGENDRSDKNTQDPEKNNGSPSHLPFP